MQIRQVVCFDEKTYTSHEDRPNLLERVVCYLRRGLRLLVDVAPLSNMLEESSPHPDFRLVFRSSIDPTLRHEDMIQIL